MATPSMPSPLVAKGVKNIKVPVTAEGSVPHTYVLVKVLIDGEPHQEAHCQGGQSSRRLPRFPPPAKHRGITVSRCSSGGELAMEEKVEPA